MRDYCAPNHYQRPAPAVLYRNEGSGRFSDVSESAGIRKAFGNGLGIAWGDFNRDGSFDVYVANDGMPNQLWINSGTGEFRDEALTLGCAVNRQGRSEAGMGVQAEDVDARIEEPCDHLGGVRRRAERGDDLDAPAASHLALVPPSLGSVRRMVQSLAACVSTSKKPVRL